MADLIYINLVSSAERKQFQQKVIEIAKYLSINPNWLMQVMYSESGLNPKAFLQLKNGKAGGLIGFMSDTAASYGTTVEKILTMTGVQQLDLVKRFYTPYKGRIKDYAHLKLVTFFPAAVGKPDDYIFQTKTLSARIIAKQNAGIDVNKDGVITMADFKAYVVNSVPVRFRKIIFGEDQRIQPTYSEVARTEKVEEKVQVGKDEEVIYFLPSDSEAEKSMSLTYPAPPVEEFSQTQEASSIAVNAVKEYYPAEEASQILKNYAPNLFPSPSSNMNIDALFTFIMSFDFFQKRLTAVPKPLVANTAREKKKILENLRNNPLFPVRKQKIPLSLGSSLSVEEIKQQLLELDIKDDLIVSITGKNDLILYIKENGYPVLEEIDPLLDLEKLIDQEIEYEDQREKFPSDDEIWACPVGQLISSDFQVDEVRRIAESSCKVDESVLEPLEVEQPEIPEAMTEAEIEDMIAEIQRISDVMTDCASEKSTAETLIQRFSRVREDLYATYFFAKERYNFFKKLESKESSPKVNLDVQDILKKSVTTLNFSVRNYIDTEILNASDSENFPGYSNQSGYNPDQKRNLFLIVNDDTVFKEVELLYEMHKDKSYLKDFLVKGSAAKKNLEKIAKTTRGIYYKDFYDKFNSVDRVDFLFTYLEQGYLIPKISAAELLTPEGQEKLKELKIDESISIEFLRTYSTREKIRAQEKLDDLKKNKFFSDLKEAAQNFSSIVYTLSLVPAGSILVKSLREEIEGEWTVLDNFYREILKKIQTLEDLSQEKQSCVDRQVNILETKYPQSPDPVNIQPAGQDPFGASQLDPRMPGPVKNYYWREYTKQLQTVSLLPIPDIQNLRKRLFRYYPVGLQIPVPVPPTVLPTLASGIPDKMISIPFPIVWKHLVTLTTPVGQFVLWLSYCAPFTFAPYLMYIDDKLNFSFLISPKGKVEIPAKSINWKEDSANNKSLMERIPGLKVPVSSMPAVDRIVDPNNLDGKKDFLQELQSRIKRVMDKLDSSVVPNRQRVADRSKLLAYGEKIKSSLDLEKGNIDLATVKEFIDQLKEIVRRKTIDTLDFEPFEIPKTQKKRKTELPPVNNFKNVISKIKELRNTGALIETKSLNLEKVLSSEALKVLDTDVGKKISSSLEKSLSEINRKLEREQQWSKKVIQRERSKTVLRHTKELIVESLDKISEKSLGFSPSPLNLEWLKLPEPAFSDVKLEPMPPILGAVVSSLKNVVNNLDLPDVEEIFYKEYTSSINISGRLPSGKDLLTTSVTKTLESLLSTFNPGIPGWPNDIVYPTSASLLKQALKDLKNSIWSLKLTVSIGGIAPIKITPDMVKTVAAPVLDASLDLVFARLIQEFDSLAFEQNGPASIKLRNSLQIFAAIFGSEIWDVKEQDLKMTAIAFSKHTLETVNSALESLMNKADVAEKSYQSFLKKFAPFSKQNSNLSQDSKIDIGSPIAKALFATITSKLVTGAIPAPPFPAVLLGCALGDPGWKTFTKVDPFRAVEKLPPYERLSLKNVPMVIFLDQLATTAQRYGGVASNYVPPYFTPDS